MEALKVGSDLLVVQRDKFPSIASNIGIGVTCAYEEYGTSGVGIVSAILPSTTNKAEFMT